MLYTALIHPPLLKALAAAGHGSKVLIADGNYPLATHTNERAEQVYLNLSPGLITVTDILVALVTVLPIEAAQVMRPDNSNEPAIFADFRRQLPELALQGAQRFAFYDLAKQDDVALVIASGDQRLFANILLTIGVVPPA